MKNKAVLWLRISYWAGACLDFATLVMMLFPSLFVFMNRPNNFQADLAYRYAMGMGAPLMLGWTILLLWADRKPVERKDVIPLTLLVIAGEITVQIWGILAGFVSIFALLPTFVMQAILIALYSFSYLNLRNHDDRAYSG